MDKDQAEPLTVVEIPSGLMREVEKGRRYISMPVPTDFLAWFTHLDEVPNVPEQCSIRVVHLRMEPIQQYKDGVRSVLHWQAVPEEEELALLLRAAFLPGQTNELRRRESQARFQGMLDVIGRH